ncbi:MAG TPA: hypothetical protein ACHBX0_02140 [Arsenophonus sp.]
MDDHVASANELTCSIFAKFPKIIFSSCYQLGHDSGKDINDICYFHIYDPISWVREISTKVLQISKDKILIVFDKYGSLEPSQNFFALIELNGLDLVTGDLIIFLDLDLQLHRSLFY